MAVIKKVLALNPFELLEDDRGVVGIVVGTSHEDMSHVRFQMAARTRSNRIGAIDCVEGSDVEHGIEARKPEILAFLEGDHGPMLADGFHDGVNGFIVQPGVMRMFVTALGATGVANEVDRWVNYDETWSGMPRFARNLIKLLMEQCGLQREEASEIARHHVGNKPERFRSTLDVRAITFLEGNPWIKNYMRYDEWVGMDSTFGNGTPLLDRLEQFPQHAGAICGLWAESRRVLTEEMDDASFLKTAIRTKDNRFAEKTNAVPRALARSGRGELPKKGDFVIGAMPATEIAIFLDKMPPDWIPDSDDEWKALYDIVDVMTWSRRSKLALEPRVLFDSSGRWREYADRIMKSSGTHDGNGLKNATKDIEDMVNAFIVQILAPALGLTKCAAGNHGWLMTAKLEYVLGVPKADVAGMLFESCSLPRIFEVSQLWHRRLPEIGRRIEELSPEMERSGRWTAGLPDWVFGDMEICVLTDEGQLKDEGRRGLNADGTMGLDHCVGSYAGACAEGRSRILSLRKSRGDDVERVSTAEIETRDAGNLKVLQHRGWKNLPPCEEAAKALHAYMKELDEGRLLVDARDLNPRIGEGSLGIQAGYEFWQPGAFRKAVEAWGACLPRRMRGWGHEEFTNGLDDFFARGRKKLVDKEIRSRDRGDIQR